MSTVDDTVLYSNYRELAASIVLQICRDYIRARKYLAKHDLNKIENELSKSVLYYAYTMEHNKSPEEIKKAQTAYFNKKKHWTTYIGMKGLVDSIENDLGNSSLHHWLTLLGIDVSTETFINSLRVKGDKVSTVIDGFTYKK